MDRKKDILKLLYQNNGSFVSGEAIAKSLQISRNTVWKYINDLKSEGYCIVSQGNQGYLLNIDGKKIDEFLISMYLPMFCRVIYFEKGNSSNTIAKEIASEGAGEGTVIVLKSQSNGRGRMGRSFLSASENGAYFSFIVKPDESVEATTFITVIAAVAVSQTIDKFCRCNSKIKWVNDIFVKDKKVCGILTEASVNIENSSIDYCVVGIGINISPPDNGFDESIKNIAGSLFDSKQTENLKAKIIGSIISEFFNIYMHGKRDEIINVYKAKSNIIGKTIEIKRGDKTFSGEAIDIDDECRLVVKTDKGTISFNSGDARIIKKE